MVLQSKWEAFDQKIPPIQGFTMQLLSVLTFQE